MTTKNNESSDLFATTFLTQIYNTCMEWIKQHLEYENMDVRYNISMLTHICHPKRWVKKIPTKNEMEALTTFLGSVEPCFREHAKDLWDQIDRFATTYAIYSSPSFDSFDKNGFVIEKKEEEEEDPVMRSTAPAPPPSPKENDDDDDEYVGIIKKRPHPLIEIEDLDDDGDDDDDDDDDDKDDDKPDLIEVPDATNRNIEVLTTPVNKKPKMEVPPTPRVLRKKIIIWSTTKK